MALRTDIAYEYEDVYKIQVRVVVQKTGKVYSMGDALCVSPSSGLLSRLQALLGLSLIHI